MYLCKVKRQEIRQEITDDLLHFKEIRNISSPFAYPQKKKKVQQSACHNWQIELFFVGRELNQDGMVIDFTHVKKAVHGKMDHANLNEVFDFNPTAENIGRWLVDLFPECYKATVQESFGNTAVVVDEEKIRGIEHLVP